MPYLFRRKTLANPDNDGPRACAASGAPSLLGWHEFLSGVQCLKRIGMLFTQSG